MILLEAFQGFECDRVLQIKNLDGTDAVNTYTSATVVQCAVWEGQNQATIFAPTVDWWTNSGAQTGYDEGQVAMSILGSSTLGLDPAGEYYGLITATTGGITSPAAEFRLKVLASPGSSVPNPPDLITYDYCMSQLSGVSFSDAQRDNVPYLVAAASQAVRRFCQDRNFDLRTYVESYPVTLDGFVRLYQVPVNQVIRVQASPQQALTISNTSSGVQTAQAYFAYTGQVGGYGANAQVVTGITLNSISSGVLTTTTVSYTTGWTVNDLATAINLVGGGWVATVQSDFGLWPVTELEGGLVSQGCGINSLPSQGAIFNVLTDLSNASFGAMGQETGFLYVGQQNSNTNAGRWGPGGYELWGNGSVQPGRAKITYSAGFTTIPPAVQYWCAQLVKWEFEVARQEFLLMSEKAADYSYELATIMVKGMPDTVRQGLSQWRLHYA